MVEMIMASGEQREDWFALPRGITKSNARYGYTKHIFGFLA